MAGGNGVELQQRNTMTPWGNAGPGLAELLQQMGGVFSGNMAQFNNLPDRDISGLGITTPQQYQGLLRHVGNTPTASENNLQDYASGSMIGNNPFTDQMIQQQAGEAMRRATSGVGAMGRGGSGLAQRMLADTYARSTIPYYQQQYEADTNRQFAANQMLDSNWFNKMGLQRGLLGDQTNAEQAAIALQPVIDQLETWDPRWDIAQRYGGILAGATPYGTKETFEPPPSPLQIIMGILSSVGGLAGGLLGDRPGGGGGDQLSTSLQGGLPRRRPSEGILGGTY